MDPNVDPLGDIVWSHDEIDDHDEMEVDVLECEGIPRRL